MLSQKPEYFEPVFKDGFKFLNLITRVDQY
jgi:hypothetical protein